MIGLFYTRNSQIRLIKKSELILGKNVFSILVGKNGTGKSTLLQQIAGSTIKAITKQNKGFYRAVEFNLFEDNYLDDIPTEVIAVSTSPFDKFPIAKVDKIKHYTYLGIRDINSIAIGVGYLSKIIVSLIDSINKQVKQANEISNVLEFLGYIDEMNIVFYYTIHPQQFEENLIGKNITEEFDNRDNPIFRKINREFFTNDDNSINEKKLKKLQKIIEQFDEKRQDLKNFNLIINRRGFKNVDSAFTIENLIFLFEIGMLKLKDVLLTSIRDLRKYSIKEASSGEQSIILSILGIASRIKDNCLILIDEPEVCLHPQWQEKYIDILTKTFDKYQNCQFIIATHSPLIISRLSNYNSFIIDMESMEIQNADLFINNSVDFQLANVFNYPGFKNEYLLRIAVSIFSNYSKKKYFSDKDNYYYNLLKEQSRFLREDDPVYDLFKTLKHLKEDNE